MKPKNTCPACHYPVQGEVSIEILQKGITPICRECALKSKSLRNVIIVERKITETK